MVVAFLLFLIAQDRTSCMDQRSFCRVPFFISILFIVENLFFSTKYGISWFKATLSHIFDKIDNSEIGLLLFACSWSPSLRIGDTSAFSKHLEKYHYQTSHILYA